MHFLFSIRVSTWSILEALEIFNSSPPPNLKWNLLPFQPFLFLIVFLRYLHNKIIFCFWIPTRCWCCFFHFYWHDTIFHNFILLKICHHCTFNVFHDHDVGRYLKKQSKTETVEKAFVFIFNSKKKKKKFKASKGILRKENNIMKMNGKNSFFNALIGTYYYVSNKWTKWLASRAKWSHMCVNITQDLTNS